MTQDTLAIDILTNPSTSHWLKSAIKELSDRDPVDAFNDAETLTRAENRIHTLIP